MLTRYLGSKGSMIEPILEAVRSTTPPGGRVGDLFAGTMTVSLALKQAGFRVVANDINHFSGTCGRAFVVPNNIPVVDSDIVPSDARRRSIDEAERRVLALRGAPGYSFLHDEANRTAYTAVVAIIVFLESAQATSLPSGARRSDFFDTYTEQGRKSAFESSRGTSGRRRFFSPANGRQIDVILTHLRYWYRNVMISPELLAFCSSALCRAAEQVGNTQGTWHDFPRDWIDSRALQSLHFTPPPMDATLAGGEHIVGDAVDSLEFAITCPSLDTLYLDPPYNFRQYTSYYFLPNVITMYPFIDDLDAFFDNVEFVRGQNMTTDHRSVFCRKGEFVPALGELVSRVDTRTVVLSYFNGRNHWNNFKEDPNDIGRENLCAFFESSLFEPGSLTVVPVPRKNYQSYKGYKALNINEYLFIARKQL